MLNLKFGITNPWVKESFRAIWTKCLPVTQNKALEFELFRCRTDLLGIDLDMRIMGRDHAGLQMSFTLLTFTFSVSLCDNRHWDYSTNSWEK